MLISIYLKKNKFNIRNTKLKKKLNSFDFQCECFFSGPRRYDFVENTWIYSHDPSDTLHEFLSKELQTLCKREIDLSHLTYAKRS